MQTIPIRFLSSILAILMSKNPTKNNMTLQTRNIRAFSCFIRATICLRFCHLIFTKTDSILTGATSTMSIIYISENMTALMWICMIAYSHHVSISFSMAQMIISAHMCAIKSTLHKSIINIQHKSCPHCNTTAIPHHFFGTKLHTISIFVQTTTQCVAAIVLSKMNLICPSP